MTDQNMKTVEIYIGTDLRGPAKGEGKVIYIMRMRRQKRKDHESQPAIRAVDDVTESCLILYALWDALQRFNFACDVVIYTECSYVAAAINNMWPDAWRENSWRNARGQQVKNWGLWEMILRELEETGHTIRAVPGKHEFSNWMRCNIPNLPAEKDVFTAVEPKELNLVSDRIC